MSAQAAVEDPGNPGQAGTVGSDDRYLSGLLALLGMPLSASEGDVLRTALGLAMDVTRSPIGYLHYVNDDQETLELGVGATWAGGQAAPGHDRRIPIPASGWGIPVWRRRPHTDNDVQSRFRLPGLLGAGGRPRRHLGVPVLSDGRVALLLGLGDRSSPYGAGEVRAAGDVAEATWRVLSRLREHRAAADDLRMLSDNGAGLLVGTWRWDPAEDVVAWGQASALLLAPPGSARDAMLAPTWSALEERLEPFSRYGLRQARTELEEGQPLELELWARDPQDQPMKLHLRGRWAARTQGSGFVLQGTLSDITAQEHAERARDRATRDPLTGLTNRAGLIADLNRRVTAGRRRADDQFSVHMLDLNKFKQINDTHGHLIGDAVLRITAGRLRGLVRRDDLVARLGGDEFVVVQSHCGHRAGIEALAARVITALTEPIDVRGLTVSVGTSIGVACSDPERPSVRELLERADEALYHAKREGIGLHISSRRIDQADPPGVPVGDPERDELAAG